MTPHPEGGAFRETYRCSVGSQTSSPRSAGTAIYFLLRKGEQTAWHSVRSDEIYHFYGGSPLVLRLINHTGKLTKTVLGVDLETGQRPQILIPAGTWQSAESTGEFTLIGCTVSPGFDFADFTMATPDDLAKKFPHLAPELLKENPS